MQDRREEAGSAPVPAGLRPPLAPASSPAPDPLARFRKHYDLPSTTGLSAAFSSTTASSSSVSSSSRSNSSSSAARRVVSGTSTGGLHIQPPHFPTFADTIAPTLRRQAASKTSTTTPDSSSGAQLSEQEVEYLKLYVRYHAPIQRRKVARKTARAYIMRKRKRGTAQEIRPAARERLLGITLAQLDHEYGQDGLPGYPASIGPVEDKRGHAWVAKNIRVLDEIRPDLWSVPRARFQARKDRDQLTPAESARLPKHLIYSSKPTPKHPKTYPGSRAMTSEEEKEWASIGIEKDTVLEIETKCAEAVSQGLNEEKFGKMPGVTVELLKKYCQAKGFPTSGNKQALATRVWEHIVVESQAEESDYLDRLEEQNALASNSDFEFSGNKDD
eukprot:g41352.t1